MLDGFQMRFRKIRFTPVYFLAAALVFIARETDRSICLGALLILVGETLRLWANGCVGHLKVNTSSSQQGGSKIGALITGGPYAYVRHPLYLGTFLIGAGFCIAVRSFWFTGAALAFFLAVYPRKVAEEEAVLAQEWGEQFAAYRRQVHTWLPLSRPYPNPHGRWSWQGIEAAKELKTVIWLLVALTALYLHAEWIVEREPLTWKHALLLAGAFGLMGFDAGTEWARLRMQRSATAARSTNRVNA